MKHLLLLLTLLSSTILFAQEVEEFELVKQGMAYGPKKLKNAPKRVYISSFEVNYQLMLNMSETDEGGRQLGGSYRGKATAQLVLGVPGIDPNKLQQLTDRLYKEYLDRLTSQGYEIVGADKAGATEFYADYTRLKGGEISESQNPGYLSSYPTGFEWYVKKINKKGRAKNSIFDTGNKLSRDLGGVIVTKVSLNLPVFEEAESQGSKMLSKTLGGLAKVVAKPNFRLAPSISVQTGKMSGTSIPTKSTFVYFKSLKENADVNYNIKKAIEINGVFEEKKYKAVETAQVAHSGSSIGSLSIFRVYNEVEQNIQSVECDPQAYLDGAYDVSSSYLNKSLDIFFKAAAGEKIK